MALAVVVVVLSVWVQLLNSTSKIKLVLAFISKNGLRIDFRGTFFYLVTYPLCNSHWVGMVPCSPCSVV